MIRCEHCGSPLLEGAIFCGECGRAVSTTATRRAPAPASDHGTPPPPLQAPAPVSRASDPASDAWLPEATLDPATRAWLTGDDRGRPRPVDAPAIPVDTPDPFAPRTAPTHVHRAGSGLGDWTGSVPASSASAPSAAAPAGREDPDVVDLEATRRVGTPPQQQQQQQRSSEAPVDRTPPAPPAPPAPASWAPPAAEPAPVVRAAAPVTPPPAAPPAAPSWWIDRGAPAQPALVEEPAHVDAPATDAPATADGSVASEAPVTDAARPAPADEVGADVEDGAPVVAEPEAQPEPAPADEPAAPVAPEAEAPRPGDTAVVPPFTERRTYSAPPSLVAPGNHPTTCHVCGHTMAPEDIFCEECGAVRPSVTAAFTGPVVPLPTVRPDWSVEDDDVAAVPSSVGPAAPAEPSTEGESRSDAVAEQPAPLVVPSPFGVPSSGAGAVPASATIPTSAPSVEPLPGGRFVPPLPPVPMAEEAAEPPRAASLDEWARARGLGEPIPSTVADDQVPTSAEDEEDVDATRIVDRSPRRAPLILHFSTGERVGVVGTGLVGRLPRPEPGERFDDLIAIVDPGKSVSKTHLEIGREGSDLWVSDRFSGNGSVIRHIDGSIRRCEPGRRYRVERGARVDIGEQFFLVQ